ncbi:MAG: hypothetical protein EXS52_00615 [Candidatus Staskawiczbacteria bacterium]|nr:hypothetical protein [Candidatus Staskawiczbacteria bacterium]
MDTKSFIEDTFSISTKDVLQDKLYSKINNAGAGKGHPAISYWLQDATDPLSITLSVNGGEPQGLNFEWVNLTYGIRAYFLCSCGVRVGKLYVPIGGTELKCRKCYHLQYFLTTFNKNSVAGMQIYKMNRLQKLADSRANMGRILYDGEYTKRFKRFIGLCDKAGFNSAVEGANHLMALIKG